MDESILDTIKKLLGIDKNYTAFDTDVIVHINSELAVLTQNGIGPATGFSISGADEKWRQFIDSILLNTVKSYIYFKVRLAFDPPSTSFGIAAFEKQAAELLWRAQIEAETFSSPNNETDLDGGTF